MRRMLASIGVISLGLFSMGYVGGHELRQPPLAPVPTAKKVVKTPPARPPAPSTAPAPPAAVAAPVTPTAPAAPALTSAQQARQGVVVIERQGKPLALGFVLEGDGRVLTALSALGNGNFVSARYADGVVAPAKLTFSDRGWDLALLTATAPAPTPAKPGATPVTPAPAPADKRSGLRAARAPSFLGLQSFNLAPPNTVAAGPASLKLSPDLLGADSATLTGAYELGTKPALVGAPVINPEGEVVAIVARACPAGGTAPCVPAPYGAPVTALKQFLQRVPATATWLGVEAAGDDARGVRGVRIVAVVPGSPAAAAGLRPGPDALQADLVVAVDGSPVGTPAELNEAVRGHAAGDSVELLLFGLGRYRHATLKPRPAPDLASPVTAPRPRRPGSPNPYR